MKILITGICGFVGTNLAQALLEQKDGIHICGIDNMSRSGSHVNRQILNNLGIKVHHADVRLQSDMDMLESVDWIIDAAANPSVMAGVDGRSSARQLIDNNLSGTINILECARSCSAGVVLLSTSRVYSIQDLVQIPLETKDNAFHVKTDSSLPLTVSRAGINEDFSTRAPISLYGSTKLASELISQEYANAYDMPIWINRCGVMAGGGQFGRPDQGIFSFWINSYLRKRPLKYIGWNGDGHQVRDCLHPRDLATLLLKQLDSPAEKFPQPYNVSGGVDNSMSLRQLSDWCAQRFSRHEVASDFSNRKFDVPWLILDSTRAENAWTWKPTTKLSSILEEIAAHAESHPDWLELSNA